MPSRAGVPIERIGREQLTLTSPAKPPPDNHPRPHLTSHFRILVFSAGLGGKDESADRAKSSPRSTIVRVKFLRAARALGLCLLGLILC